MTEIRNYRTLAEKKKQEDDYMKLLKLQQQLERLYDDSNAEVAEAVRTGIKPLAPPRKSVVEEEEDRILQYNILRKNLNELMSPIEAQKVFEDVHPDDYDLVLIINQNFPDIEKQLSGRSKSTISNTFFKAFLQKYIQRLEKTAVRNPEGTFYTGVFDNLQADDFKGILREKTADIINKLNKKIDRATQFYSRDVVEKVGEIMDSLSGIKESAPVLRTVAEMSQEQFNEFIEEVADRLTKSMSTSTIIDKLNYIIQNLDSKRPRLLPASSPPREWFEELEESAKGSTPRLRNMPMPHVGRYYTIELATNANDMLDTQKLTVVRATKRPDILNHLWRNRKWFLENDRLGSLPTEWRDAITQGAGVKKTKKPKRQYGGKIIGYGIKAKQENRYEDFGRWIIHMPSLRRSVLNLKFPSQGAIPKMPQKAIGKELTEFLLDTVEGGRINNRLLEKLPEGDQSFFKSLARQAGILHQNEEELKDEDFERFELLRGQVMAGNDNAQILKEMKVLLIKLVGNNKIPKQQGYEILSQLVAVS
jgi:hypothetical protein